MFIKETGDVDDGEAEIHDLRGSFIDFRRAYAHQLSFKRQRALVLAPHDLVKIKH
jgi:hypothetical protein